MAQVKESHRSLSCEVPIPFSFHSGTCKGSPARIPTFTTELDRSKPPIGAVSSLIGSQITHAAPRIGMQLPSTTPPNQPSGPSTYPLSVLPLRSSDLWCHESLVQANHTSMLVCTMILPDMVVSWVVPVCQEFSAPAGVTLRLVEQMHETPAEAG